MMAAESEKPVLKNHWAKECAVNSFARPTCQCLGSQWGKAKQSEPVVHTEEQDTSCAGWLRLLELIDEAERDQRAVFSPGTEMTPEEWSQIVTLPSSIAKLQSVKHLILYGSSLVRIPIEIGELTNLEEFTPYTSYRLHWFPYEITGCTNLRRSTVSTRALYGNYKSRPHFPRLPKLHDSYVPKRCSVCNDSFGDTVPMQYWVTLPVGTDMLPLLVHACSQDCLARIPKPPEGYVRELHQGGRGLVQPKCRF